MRIMHVMLSCFYIDNYSYQENMLPKYHKQMGHEVRIVASLATFDEKGKGAWLPKASRYINEHGIHVSRLDFKKGRFSKRTRKYIGFAEELEEFRPELVFVHGVSFSDVSVLVKYLKKYPEVIVYADNHTDFSNSARNWVSKNIQHRIMWRRCARKLVPYTKKFYGVLPARVDFLVDMYKIPKDKVELLVMGADDERVAEASAPEVRSNIREKYGLAEDDFVIMTGGKIDAFKTQTLLLMEAVRNIDNPKVKLVVFGSVTPELKEGVEALADGVRVQYIGWILANDSYDYFAAADLVVFPGRHSVFWEQVAAQGIPMLCKRWDGTTHVDVCGNVCFLEKDSAEEIKGEIERLLVPDNYNDIKQAAETASADFMYSGIAKKSIEGI